MTQLALSLMYHDVVADEAFDGSGFPSADAALYKLTTRQFDEHLHALTQSCAAPVSVFDLAYASASNVWTLTFDDGGLSAHTEIADRLEARGWRGHFFITTDYLDKPGFLTAAQVRDLHQRGHLIGSHSCSHPLRMSSCSATQIEREWRESLRVLSDVLGEQVTLASIPGGAYSTQVAESAAAAGIKALFTSEPTARLAKVDGCLILGRYAIQRWTPAATAAAIAAGAFSPRARQAVLWQAKKMTKSLGGEFYLKVRASLSKTQVSSTS